MPLPSLNSKADKLKSTKLSRSKQGATTRNLSGKSSDAVGAGTSSKATRPSTAKRTPKPQKYKCGKKVCNNGEGKNLRKVMDHGPDHRTKGRKRRNLL